MKSLSRIPAELRNVPQWGLWKAVSKGGRLLKIPYSAVTGKAARTNKPGDWTDYKTAQKALGNGGGYSGLGFRFDSANGIVGLDLDNALDATGQPKPWAQAIIDEAQSYAEISPSGKGLHVFLRGTKPTSPCRTNIEDGHLEIYDSGRYFTVTGNVLEARPVEARQAELDEICARYLSGPGNEAAAPDLAGLSFEDAALIQQASSAKNGEKFKRLWTGDTDGYPSASEADAALISLLLFWTRNDEAKADALFRQSGLFRDKWDRNAGGGRTYGERTIETALANAAKRQADETEAAQELREKVAAGVRASIKPLQEFSLTAPPPRATLLHPWLTEQSIAMVWGERGVGKTFFIMGVLEALTTGKPFGPWVCTKTAPCLLLDGELVHSDVAERLSGLASAQAKTPLYIYSSDLAARLGHPAPDFDDPTWREAMREVLLDLKVGVFVIDNVSSLTSLDENDKAAWSPVNKWLLGLRFAGVSSILVHHSNKTGNQRGTSAREDNLDTSIQLFRPKDYAAGQGARFGVRFTKARIPHAHLHLIAESQFRMEPDEAGRTAWTHNSPQREIKGAALQLLAQGKKQVEVADALGVTRAYVSMIRKDAYQNGLINDNNELTDKGRAEIEWS